MKSLRLKGGKRQQEGKLLGSLEIKSQGPEVEEFEGIYMMVGSEVSRKRNVQLTIVCSWEGGGFGWGGVEGWGVNADNCN